MPADARPMPRAEPVISAARPANRPVIARLGSHKIRRDRLAQAVALACEHRCTSDRPGFQACPATPAHSQEAGDIRRVRVVPRLGSLELILAFRRAGLNGWLI